MRQGYRIKAAPAIDSLMLTFLAPTSSCQNHTSSSRLQLCDIVSLQHCDILVCNFVHFYSATNRLDVFATTVKKMWYDKTRYFHVYYDEVVGSLRKQRFLSALGKIDRELSDLVGKKLRANTTHKKYAPWFDLDIDKESNVLRSYKKRGERIRERLLMFGFFAIMTTEDMSAETALGIYRARDNIEKFLDRKSVV